MKAAIQFIEAIASNMTEASAPLKAIADTLCDGEALMHLGVTDDDQAMVEEAYAIVCEWIEKGHKTLSEAKAAH